MKNILFLIAILSSGFLSAQNTFIVQGTVTEENEQAVGWATVMLYDLSQATLLAGGVHRRVGPV